MGESSNSPAIRHSATAESHSIFVLAPDGLRLHVRAFGLPSFSTVPVVCLPGLTRTTADFDALALALSSGEPQRRVIALDSRGRGRSADDRNTKNYTLAVELADVIAVLTQLEIGSAIFVGSSRGGILTMLLAAAHREMITGAVLHESPRRPNLSVAIAVRARAPTSVSFASRAYRVTKA